MFFFSRSVSLVFFVRFSFVHSKATSYFGICIRIKIDNKWPSTITIIRIIGQSINLCVCIDKRVSQQNNRITNYRSSFFDLIENTENKTLSKKPSNCEWMSEWFSALCMPFRCQRNFTNKHAEIIIMNEKRQSNFMRFNCEIRACNQSAFELTFSNTQKYAV